MRKKVALVTGASGFVGFHMVSRLSSVGYDVIAICRPGSLNNGRLLTIPNVDVLELDLNHIEQMHLSSECKADVMFHFAWYSEGRYDSQSEFQNIEISLNALKVAKLYKCDTFIASGSQAEYGIVPPGELICEDRLPNPFCAYGSAKVACRYLTKYKAKEYGINWNWGIIFSLYGKYEPFKRLVPSIVNAIRNKEVIELSSCRQNWDFLDAEECADAFIAIYESGCEGEVFNIADGRYKPLRIYIEDIIDFTSSKNNFIFGEDAIPFVSLQPDVKKIKNITGWFAKYDFVNRVNILF